MAPRLTRMTENAPQRRHYLREVFNRLLFVAQVGLQGKLMPHDLLPRPTA